MVDDIYSRGGTIGAARTMVSRAVQQFGIDLPAAEIPAVTVAREIEGRFNRRAHDALNLYCWAILPVVIGEIVGAQDDSPAAMS